MHLGETTPIAPPASQSHGHLRAWRALRLTASVRREQLRGLPVLPAWLLAITIFLAAPAGGLYPAAGLDPSWGLGLNLARVRHLRFGPQLVFTYGPWGLLDEPSALDQSGLVAATLFAVLAAGALWLAGYFSLRRVLGQTTAAVATSLLVAYCSLTFMPSALLFTALLLALLGYLDRSGEFAGTGGWTPAVAALAAALLIQVKFSEGVALAACALAAAPFAPARRGRRIAETLLALLLGTIVWWLLAGQSLADLPGWLREMAQVAGGYPDAMSVETQPNALPYLLIIGSWLLVAGYLVGCARRRPARITAGIAVLAVLALYLGFRQGTGRHGPGNQQYYYLCGLPVLIWAVGPGRRLASRLVLVGLVALLLGGSWLPLAPDQAMSRWNDQFEALLDPGYRASQLQQAQLAAQHRYQLSPTMRAAVTGPPVTVDSWEASLAWAYDLNWRPAPVFQSYVAYTAELDELNSAALADAPADQVVLRQVGLNSVDGRSRLWDPPRYLLTELCDYRTAMADSRWLMLRKDVNRCAASQPVQAERVSAGQRTSVPTPDDPDSIVLMSFRPATPSPLVRLGRLLDKSFHPLRVTADGTGYRLPRALADGPLVVRLPTGAGWPAAFGGGTDYRTVSFSEAGTVQFSVVRVG